MIQEPFVSFLYEFQPETFPALIERNNPLNSSALKQRITPDLKPDPVFSIIFHVSR
jgi:hypothetical protein